MTRKTTPWIFTDWGFRIVFAGPPFVLLAVTFVQRLIELNQ